MVGSARRLGCSADRLFDRLEVGLGLLGRGGGGQGAIEGADQGLGDGQGDKLGADQPARLIETERITEPEENR